MPGLDDLCQLVDRNGQVSARFPKPAPPLDGGSKLSDPVPTFRCELRFPAPELAVLRGLAVDRPTGGRGLDLPTESDAGDLAATVTSSIAKSRDRISPISAVLRLAGVWLAGILCARPVDRFEGSMRR